MGPRFFIKLKSIFKKSPEDFYKVDKSFLEKVFLEKSKWIFKKWSTVFRKVVDRFSKRWRSVGFFRRSDFF